MRAITLVSPADLPRARVLARSLRAHEPAWSHELLLMGTTEAASSLAAAGEPLRSVCTELELELEPLLALHDAHELSVLLLPELLRSYTARTLEPVVHIPSSAWVLAGLQPLSEALAANGLVLVPRATEPLPEDGLEPDNEQLEDAGRVDPTMIAVAPGDRPGAFLTWWDERVQQTLGSRDARRSGARPEDRSWLARFLELAPARFAAAVLEDPGCNLSMWNLHLHRLAASGEGVEVDGSWPLRFLELPGFEPDRPHMLNRMASRARVSRSPALHELCESYAAQLLECGWQDIDHRTQIGRPLLDGLIYDEPLRRVYSTSLALGERFGDLFTDEGARAFVAWLEAPAPRGGAYGITRYVFHRVARERPDVVRAYPDLDGESGKEFVEWCRAFGVEELGLPERFMPRAGRRAGAQSAGAAYSSPPGSAVGDPRAAAARPPAGADGEAHDGGSPSHAGSPLAGAADTRAQAAANGSGQLAVRVTGYLGHALGLGAAGRAYTHALRAAGVSVSTVTVPLHHLRLPVALEPDYGQHSFEDLAAEGSHQFELIAVNADELPDMLDRLGGDYFHGPRIGIWGWETNSIPPRWKRAFSLVDEIWVYSRFMAVNIGAAAPVPVIALPPPVDRLGESPEPTRLGVPGGFLFLFLFDYLSTIQRKNPVGLIEAFKLAFTPGEGPQLLIKTLNGPLRPLAEEEVLWAAHGRPDIHVIDRSLTAAELHGLMAACDCYSSLHRAEGFGLTMAEAMALGKPVLATGYSGNVDFMTPQNSYLVDYTMGRVGADCEIYPPDGEWAEPDVEQAAELMRRIYARPEEASGVGARARADVVRLLSPEATGAAMRARLQELAGRAPARSTSIH